MVGGGGGGGGGEEGLCVNSQANSAVADASQQVTFSGGSCEL